LTASGTYRYYLQVRELDNTDQTAYVETPVDIRVALEEVTPDTCGCTATGAGGSGVEGAFALLAVIGLFVAIRRREAGSR